MATYVVKRLLQTVVVLILLSLLVFLMVRLLPGDPIRMVLTSTDSMSYTEEQVAQLRHEYGLDKPLMVQYGVWLGDLFRGDMGNSILTGAPVSAEIFKRFLITLHIGVLALIVGVVIGMPLGIVSAVRRGTWIDQLVMTGSNIGVTVPIFLLGLVLMYVFGLWLGWLPLVGYTSPFTDFWLSTKQLIMPVACLCLFPLAAIARQTRSSMLEVIQQDYIRTAFSKGLRERTVVWRHALKNGLVPIISTAGVFVPMVVGGAVVIETVFNIPGLGRLAVTAVLNQDYPYVQGCLLVVAVAVMVANLAADFAYAWADPRIRFE